MIASQPNIQMNGARRHNMSYAMVLDDFTGYAYRYCEVFRISFHANAASVNLGKQKPEGPYPFPVDPDDVRYPFCLALGEPASSLAHFGFSMGLYIQFFPSSANRRYCIIDNVLSSFIILPKRKLSKWRAFATQKIY